MNLKRQLVYWHIICFLPPLNTRMIWALKVAAETAVLKPLSSPDGLLSIKQLWYSRECKYALLQSEAEKELFFPPFFCFCSVHSFPCRFEAVFHPACRQQAVPSYSRVLNGWGSNWPITDLAAYHCLPAFSGTLHSQHFFLLCLWWGEEDK